MTREDVINIVEEELDSFLADEISYNIEKTGQRASGFTQENMWTEKKGNAVTLFGREGFKNLEEGYKGKVPINILYQWSKDKGIQFDTDEDRMSFAYTVKYVIENEGTYLYRNKPETWSGETADVYSTAIQDCIERIQERLGEKLLIYTDTELRINTFD